MIGALDGRILQKAPPHLLLDIAGVGYEIEAPMSTFYGMPPVGERLRLLTHLVVREDAHILYGFATAEERQLFRNLLRVSGVGPRMALVLLSGMSVQAFELCIRAEDAGTLTKVPGIGRKTAERLIIEMRDRLDGAASCGDVGALAMSGAGAGGPATEAFSALVALGYKPAEATRLLKHAGEGSTEDRIRAALQSAAKD